MSIVEELKQELEINEEQAVKIVEKWVADYEDLSRVVNKAKADNVSFKDLKDQLEGFNEDFSRIGFFDLNYKSLLTTVHSDFTLSEDVTCYVDNGLEHVVDVGDHFDAIFECIRIKTLRDTLLKNNFLFIIHLR